MGATYKSERWEWDFDDGTLETEGKVPKRVEKVKRIQLDHKVAQRWTLKSEIETYEHIEPEELNLTEFTIKRQETQIVADIIQKTVIKNKWFAHTTVNKPETHIVQRSLFTRTIAEAEWEIQFIRVGEAEDNVWVQ